MCGQTLSKCTLFSVSDLLFSFSMQIRNEGSLEWKLWKRLSSLASYIKFASRSLLNRHFLLKFLSKISVAIISVSLKITKKNNGLRGSRAFETDADCMQRFPWERARNHRSFEVIARILHHVILRRFHVSPCNPRSFASWFRISWPFWQRMWGINWGRTLQSWGTFPDQKSKRPLPAVYGLTNDFTWENSPMHLSSSDAGNFSPKHESNILRSFIQVLSQFSMGQTVQSLSTDSSWRNHIQGWMTVWICYSRALERRCLLGRCCLDPTFTNVGIIILDFSIAIALSDPKVGSQLSENSPSEDLPSQSNQEGIFQLVEAELVYCTCFKTARIQSRPLLRLAVLFKENWDVSFRIGHEFMTNWRSWNF